MAKHPTSRPFNRLTGNGPQIAKPAEPAPSPLKVTPIIPDAVDKSDPLMDALKIITGSKQPISKKIVNDTISVIVSDTVVDLENAMVESMGVLKKILEQNNIYISEMIPLVNVLFAIFRIDVSAELTVKTKDGVIPVKVPNAAEHGVL